MILFILEIWVLKAVTVNLVNTGFHCIKIKIVLHIEMFFAPRKKLHRVFVTVGNYNPPHHSSDSVSVNADSE